MVEYIGAACHPVDSVFEIDGKKYKVVLEGDEYKCYSKDGDSCAFLKKGGTCGGLLCKTGDCRKRFREDRQMVVFVEVKGGEDERK